MTCQLTKIVSFACLFLGIHLKAQTADTLFKRDFSRISLFVQRAHLVDNTADNGADNTIGIGFDRSPSWQFGFFWNFAQTGSFNFKTGIIAKEYRPSLNIHLPMSEVGMPGGGQYTDNALTFSDGFLFSVPLKAEYYVPLYPKLNLVIGGGASINFATGDFAQEGLGYDLYDPDTNSTRSFFYAIQEQKKITYSADATVGLNYNFRHVLAQLDFIYSKSIGTTANGRYIFNNLENAADKTGSFTISGSYLGIGLTLTPRKRFWK